MWTRLPAFDMLIKFSISVSHQLVPNLLSISIFFSCLPVSWYIAWLWTCTRLFRKEPDNRGNCTLNRGGVPLIFVDLIFFFLRTVQNSLLNKRERLGREKCFFFFSHLNFLGNQAFFKTEANILGIRWICEICTYLPASHCLSCFWRLDNSIFVHNILPTSVDSRYYARWEEYNVENTGSTLKMLTVLWKQTDI